MTHHTPPQTQIPSLLHSAQRIVVKVGSSLLSPTTKGAPRLNIGGLANDIAIKREAGAQICVVSSGAVALGREVAPALGDDLPSKQALSAIGQTSLMQTWQTALQMHGIEVGQVLLTPDITGTRRRYLNARATLRTLLDHGIVPIINENDAIVTDELRYGDNDRLAAMTAGIVGADLMVLLTDTDGLYTANPYKHKDAHHIPLLDTSISSDWEHQDLGSVSGVGTGGMGSKLEAAKLAGDWGINVVIASGHPQNPLSALLNSTAKGTVIPASRVRVPARRRWLEGLQPQGGVIEVDEGAATALRTGKSLLAVGIMSIDQPFQLGDAISVKLNGSPIGFGLAKLASHELESKSETLVIHRDDFVLEEK